MFKVHLILGLLLLLGVSSQNDEDDGGPYEFSFTIDGEQHRYEKKDINGIIQGEFGFITGDGVYHVSVYATDENGSFKILSMKNTKISEPLDQGGKPNTAGLIRQPSGGVPSKLASPVAQPSAPVPIPTQPVAKPTQSAAKPPQPIAKPPQSAAKPAQPAAKPTQSAAKPAQPAAKPAQSTIPPTLPAAKFTQPAVTTSRTPYDFTTASTVRSGCSGCGIVTKAPPGPLKFQNPIFKEPSKESNKAFAPSAQSASYPNQPAPPQAASGNGIPSGLVSKQFSPAGEPSTYPNTPSGSSISLPNSPVNTGTSNGQPAQSASYPNQPVSPPPASGNGIPSGLVSKSFAPAGQPSTYPNPPSNSNAPVNIETGNGQPAQSLYPNQPVLPPAASGNGVPSGLVSKSFAPAGQPSTYPNPPSSSNAPVNIGTDNGQPAQSPYPNQPVLPSAASGNGVPSGLVSKSFSPAGQPSTYPNPPSSSNAPVNIGTDNGQPAQSPYPNQPVLPPAASGNGVPSGLVSKPFAPAGQPSTYPNPPSGPNSPVNIETGKKQPSPPQTFLLAPGTNPAPTGSATPTQQNPFGPQPVNQPTSIDSPRESKSLGARPPVVPPSISKPLSEPIQNQIPPSSLSQVKVTNGAINIPGNEPIQIKDKYPNMVDGLPEGITERDITDLLYKFNYTVGFHGHYEKGLKNGAKVGGYFVNGRDGISRVVTYVADENGYRPKFKLINLGLDSEDTPKPDSEKKFGLKNFEFVWYPVK